MQGQEWVNSKRPGRIPGKETWTVSTSCTVLFFLEIHHLPLLSQRPHTTSFPSLLQIPSPGTSPTYLPCFILPFFIHHQSTPFPLPHYCSAQLGVRDSSTILILVSVCFSSCPPCPTCCQNTPPPILHISTRLS